MGSVAAKNDSTYVKHNIHQILLCQMFKYGQQCLFDVGAYYNIFGKIVAFVRVVALNRPFAIV